MTGSLKITTFVYHPISKNKNCIQENIVYSTLSYKLQKDTISFGSANVDKEDAFNLRNIQNLPCACCGKKMINEKEYAKFKSKDFQGPATPVLKKLKPYVPYMRSTEKTVYNLLKRAANKDPNADLNTLLKKRYYYHLGRLEIKQLKIINDVASMKLELSPKSQKELDNTLAKVREIIFVEPKETRQKRSRIIKEFETLKKVCEEKQEIDTILKKLQQLPTSKDDVDAFMIKYAQRGNREIGQRLMSPSLPTLDHIIPANKSGHDNFSNLLVMCEKCNSHRGSIPYKEWFESHPEMLKNIQKNMNKVISEINGKRLLNFDNYPQEIKNTLSNVCDYNLDISTLRR